MPRKQKSLGQIAYEASPSGATQNWGPWRKAPNVVRQVHEDIARVIQRIVKRRIRANTRKLLEALEKLAAIGESGVIERRETGKPTWNALDEIKTIARDAITKVKGD